MIEESGAALAVKPAAQVAQADGLEERARQIRSDHTEAAEMESGALARYRRIGAELCGAQDACQRMRLPWLAWCRANLPRELSEKKIQRLMAFSRECNRLKSDVTSDLAPVWEKISGNAPSASQAPTFAVHSAPADGRPGLAPVLQRGPALCEKCQRLGANPRCERCADLSKGGRRAEPEDEPAPAPSKPAGRWPQRRAKGKPAPAPALDTAGAEQPADPMGAVLAALSALESALSALGRADLMPALAALRAALNAPAPLPA